MGITEQKDDHDSNSLKCQTFQDFDIKKYDVPC